MKTNQYFVRIAILLLFTLVAGVANAQTEKGYTYSVTVQTIKDKKSEKPLILKASVVGNNGRVDVIEGDDNFKSGDYLITTDTGESFWVASVKRRELTRFSPEMVGKEIRKEKFDLNDIVIKPPKSMGVGESIAGVNTELFHMSRSYTIVAQELFWKVRVQNEEQWDYHVAPPSVSTPAFNPIASFLSLTQSAILFKNDAFAQSGKTTRLPKGFVQKMVVVAVTKEKKKEGQESTILICSAPTATAVEATLFKLPEGFKKKE